MSAGGTAPGSESAEPGERGAPASELSRGVSLGKYVVLERVGSGGMGVVYAAYDPQLNRKVAIKLLREDSTDEAPTGSSTQLLKEAQVLARLNHRNVAVVYEAGRFRNQVFIAMEFVEGGTLGEWLKTRPAWREVLACFLKAGEGLAAAHEQQILHRDFKPDNVLLDKERAPRVTDFGLAREGEVVVSERRAGPAAGTPGFLPPEQARHEPVDARGDQFSFCVSLFLGLYSEPPFERSTDFLRPLPAARAAPVGSTVPGWLRKVVLKGLSEAPGERFASMRELLAALRADPAIARRNWLAGGAGAAVFSALLGLGLFFAQRDERACVARVETDAQELWSRGRIAQIEAAFTGSGGNSGATRWSQVLERLGPQVEQWIHSSREACAFHGDPAVRARWAACLHARRKTLQSMSNLFAEADATVVDNALMTVITEVRPATACRETAPVAAPALGQVSDEELSTGLARARVWRAAGKRQQAIADLGDVLHAPHTPGLEAEARLLLGLISADLRRPEAEEHLHLAIAAADEVSNDELRVQAWNALIGWYAEQGNVPQARFADEQSRAILRRLNNPGALEAERLMAIGQLEAGLDDGEEIARRDFEQALRERRATLGEEHPLVANSLSNLGRLLPGDAGLQNLEAAYRISNQIFGSHPETADALRNLGEKYLNGNACAPALGSFEAALKMDEQNSSDPQTLGLEHAAIASALDCPGANESDLQRAERELTLAVPLLKKGGASEQTLKTQLQHLAGLRRQLHMSRELLEGVAEQLDGLHP